MSTGVGAVELPSQAKSQAGRQRTDVTAVEPPSQAKSQAGRQSTGFGAVELYIPSLHSTPHSTFAFYLYIAPLHPASTF